MTASNWSNITDRDFELADPDSPRTWGLAQSLGHLVKRLARGRVPERDPANPTIAKAVCRHSSLIQESDKVVGEEDAARVGLATGDGDTF